jgi:hypothetical protein
MTNSNWVWATVRAAVALASCLTGGCYTYHPLTTPESAAGTPVAVTLTDAGALELGPYLGSDAFIVRGRFLGTDERGVMLAVTQVETKGGEWYPWAGESVLVPAALISSFETRRLAKGRTLLLAGVGVAGLAATTAAFVLSGTGTPPGAGGPPPIKK